MFIVQKMGGVEGKRTCVGVSVCGFGAFCGQGGARTTSKNKLGPACARGAWEQKKNQTESPRSHHARIPTTHTTDH